MTKQNDHAPRTHVHPIRQHWLVEHRCGDRKKAVAIAIKAARVEDGSVTMAGCGSGLGWGWRTAAEEASAIGGTAVAGAFICRCKDVRVCVLVTVLGTLLHGVN
jgi:hypothetical protein